MISHWYVGMIMVLLPYLKKDFSLSFTEVALIMSLRFLAGAVGNASSGFIGDLVGKRVLILVLTAVGLSICWSLVGFAQVYLVLLLVLPVAHMFAGFWHAPAMSILSEAYPERKGFALGVHGAAASLGQSLSPFVMGFLIAYVGWRAATRANVAPAALLAVLLAVFLPRFGTFGSRKKTGAEFLALLKREILKHKTLFVIVLVSALRTMAQTGLETFLAIFLAGKMDLNPVWVGFYVSILGVSSTFPQPIMGWLSDVIGRKFILWMSLTISGLLMVALTFAQPGLQLTVVLVALGFFIYSLRPVIFALALDVTPPEVGASTISYIFTWNLSLSALSPIVGGFLADSRGIEFALYLLAFLSLTAAFLVTMLRPARQTCEPSL